MFLVMFQVTVWDNKQLSTIIHIFCTSLHVPCSRSHHGMAAAEVHLVRLDGVRVSGEVPAATRWGGKQPGLNSFCAWMLRNGGGGFYDWTFTDFVLFQREGGRERERTQASELYYPRIESLGNGLFLQSVLAKLQTYLSLYKWLICTLTLTPHYKTVIMSRERERDSEDLLFTSV